ncbi:MAG: hypothetical protein IPO13_14935 [Rhodocyclaceae bacterium]|nr:hypothetical protein [Rhodocyclaceae bacterium]
MVKSSISALPVGIWPPSPQLGKVEARIPPTSKKRAKGPEKLFCRLATNEDVFEAIDWRLEDWTDQALESALFHVGKLLDRGNPLDEARPDVQALMAKLPTEKRLTPWSAVCALVAHVADVRGDERLFLLAGLEVLKCYQQSRRRKGQKNVADALTIQIHGYVEEMPSITPEVLRKDFANQAAENWRGVVTDSDGTTLSFEPRAGAKIKEIKKEAFRKRVQRAKKLSAPAPD